MRNPCFIVLIIVFLSFGGYAQSRVSGMVMDKEAKPLPGATVKVIKSDSAFAASAVSDSTGRFVLMLPLNEQYLVSIALFSYKTYTQLIETKSELLRLGRITLKEDAQTLGEVKVEGVQERGKQQGDTTLFNADAYKTNPDATAEDLLKKMPGVTSDNNGVKVNGENVQKVLLDGKPFFGDDPNAAIKNIPAEIIDKVEIFDKMSDQAAFSGFNDGSQQKTINLVTKKGKNIGQFGKIFAGGGGDESLNARYSGGATLNSFSAKKRISVLLLSNNINQQNFSISDITSAMGGSENSFRIGGGSGRQGSFGGGGASSLLTTPQNGITATQAAGLNYSDEWGKRVKASGSYFFNFTDNENRSDIVRNYFTRDQLRYAQSHSDRAKNINHRLHFRMEANLDSVNKIILTPALNLQDHRNFSRLSGSNAILDSVLLSTTRTDLQTFNMGYDFSNGLLFQHRFAKQGRTMSAFLNTQLSERYNDGKYSSENVFSDTLSMLDQVYDTYGNTKKASVNLSYTEPLSKRSQLQISYNPSYQESSSDKFTSDYNSIQRDYSDFNPSLSNSYRNIYSTQRAGMSLRYNKEKLSFNMGADAQESVLDGQQEFPRPLAITQSFRNILPSAFFNYRFSKSRNLRMHYRSSTNIPSLQQLQDVVDISNPLQVRTGNALLKQTFDNNFVIRFGGFNPASSRNAMIFANAGFTENYISNATYILRKDSLIQGFEVKAGSQLTRPVNLDGYYFGRMFFVFGFPVKALRSNLNMNGGLNYMHTPSLNNDVLNFASSYAGSGGLSLSSNVSQFLDFSLAYIANYTTVRNSAQSNTDNTFYSHSASFRLNWILQKSLVINSDVSHSLYNGLTQAFNQEYILWNAYIAYKFLANKNLEAKVSAFDLLNQNRSISRTVNPNYTEDANTLVLNRYFLFTLTWTLRNFKNNPGPAEEKPEPFNPMPPRQRGPGGRPW